MDGLLYSPGILSGDAMDIGAGTKTRELIDLICLSGHITRQAAVLLCGRAIRNTIPKLQTLCTLTDGTETLGSYRVIASSRTNAITLSKRAVGLLSITAPEMVYKFECMYSTNPRQKERATQISEIYAMMIKAGVSVYPTQKQTLSMEFGGDGLSKPCFYDSLEIKKVVGVKEAGFTRMRGILFSLSGAYVSYFVNKELAEWRRNEEYKMRHKIDELTKKNFPQITRIPHDIYAVDKALIFGRNPGIMSELLGIQHTPTGISTQNFIGGGMLYDKVYFLPINETGIKILKLLAHPHNYEVALSKLPGKPHQTENDLTGANTGGKREFIYPAFTNCISELVLIGAKAFQYPTNTYRIYCLPWQLPYLRAFYGNLNNIEFKAFEFGI